MAVVGLEVKIERFTGHVDVDYEFLPKLPTKGAGEVLAAFHEAAGKTPRIRGSEAVLEKENAAAFVGQDGKHPHQEAVLRSVEQGPAEPGRDPSP